MPTKNKKGSVLAAISASELRIIDSYSTERIYNLRYSSYAAAATVARIRSRPSYFNSIIPTVLLFPKLFPIYIDYTLIGFRHRY